MAIYCNTTMQYGDYPYCFTPSGHMSHDYYSNFLKTLSLSKYMCIALASTISLYDQYKQIFSLQNDVYISKLLYKTVYVLKIPNSHPIQKRQVCYRAMTDLLH